MYAVLRTRDPRARFRVFALVAVVAMAFAAAACGDSEDSGGSPSSDAPATQQGGERTPGIARATKLAEQFTAEQPTEDIPQLDERPREGVKVAQVLCNDPTCQPEVAGEPLERLGWEQDLRIYDITKGPQEYVRQFRNALQGDPDYILLVAIFPPEVIAAELEQAKAAGIPVVAWTGNASDGWAGCYTCAPTLNKSGALQADAALADAGEKTSMVVLTDPLVIPFQQVTEGAIAEVEKNGDGSTVETLELPLAKVGPANASATISYLQRNPEVEYVLANAAPLLAGLPEQLASTGLADRVKIIGGSAQASDIAALKAGQEIAATASENEMSIWRAADLMARLEAGEDPPQSLRVPVGWQRIFTPDSAQDLPEVAPQLPDFKDVFAKAWGVE